MISTTLENRTETSVVSPQYDWSVLNESQGSHKYFEGLVVATRAVEFVCHIDGEKAPLPDDITELRSQLRGRLMPIEGDSRRDLEIDELLLVAECIGRLAQQPYGLLSLRMESSHFVGYVGIARLYAGQLSGGLPEAVQPADAVEYVI